MAILTDSIIDVGNYITFNIGLSKAISNYTADEIWNSPYCSSSWDAFRHVCDESYQGIAPGSIEASEFQMPFHFIGVNQMYTPATYNFEEGQIEYNQGEKGIYGKIIWLCVTGDNSIGHIFGTQRCITNTDGVKIITQMDMTQVYLFLDTFQDPANNDPMYVNYDNFKIKEEHEGVTTYEHAREASIFPAVMFKYNDKLYIHRIFQDTYTNLDWSWWLSYAGDSDHGGHTELQGHTFNAQPVAFTNDANAYLPINIMRQFSGLRPTSTERFYTASDIEDVGVRYQWMYGYDGGRICPATEAKYLQMASWYGMMFHHNGKYYKPVIKDGYVTGYTDDMSTPSDIDGWTGTTNHNVPPAPPGPGPGPAPGHWDDIESAGTFGSTLGFVNSYYISRAQLLALKTWMGKDEASGGPPDGYDMLNAIVGIKMYPWALATTAPDDIVVAIPGAQSMWTRLAQSATLGAILEVMQGGSPSGNAPTPIRKVNSGIKGFATKAGMLQYNLGTLNMSQFMNTTYPFLTYDATVELYIPFVGTFTLDTQTVMGRTLSCYLNLDPGTGGVYGYCMCDNTMIASGTGNIGVDVPISSAQMGIYRAQADTLAAGRMANGIISGLALSAGMPAVTAASVGAMYDARGSVDNRGLRQVGLNTALDQIRTGAGRVSTSLAATASNAVTANRSIRQLQQSHGMAMTGSTGGSTVEWCCPWQAYIKIIRPKPHDPGSNYNHAVAVPAYSSGTLSSYKGLTVCIDPDVSGLNATTEERNAIASIMQGGIIV